MLLVCIRSVARDCSISQERSNNLYRQVTSQYLKMAALQKPFKERRSYGKDVSIVFLALVNHNLFKTLLLIRNKENEDIAYNASVLEKFGCAL